ncbi:hypothetical protein [Acaryochloris sp. CCMEE 5410]|uniref:hypothetical protein n=1 Tax=Acaryochloris sp. CCMEE 5410 TaxID=310037 RepID=UPI0002485220|nr:hypothetical protein [Acaryochloris sp. CCMEE 5410]KAI9130156.1 hypothetical protein ON05_031510 [Acaryochloris sp. CCMEE 5410]
MQIIRAFKRQKLLAMGLGLFLLGTSLVVLSRTSNRPVKAELNQFTGLNQIEKALKQQTSVPPALPRKIPDVQRSSVSILLSEEKEYKVSLDVHPDCQGATVCSFGRLEGKVLTGQTVQEEYGNPKDRSWQPLAQSPLPEKTVTLANGNQGLFIPWVCGAHCSTSKIVWDQDRYRYAIGLRGGMIPDDQELDFLVAMANSAIENK